jgi:hypothetical protein
MRSVVRVNDGLVASIASLFMALGLICAGSVPARSAEAGDAVLEAAIRYLQNHIAMDILSRSQCGDRVTAEQFDSREFGTGLFLEEVSDYLSAEKVEHLNHWLLSEEYKELLFVTARDVYEIIGVKSRNRSRCAEAVDRYGSSFFRSRDDFRNLREASVECQPSSENTDNPCGIPIDAANQEAVPACEGAENADGTCAPPNRSTHEEAMRECEASENADGACRGQSGSASDENSD